MIRIRDTKHDSTSDFLSSAIAIAEYYGFVPAESVPPREKVKDEKRTPSSAQGDINYARKDERSFASSARSCVSLGDTNRTLLLWRMGNQRAGERPTALNLELHVVGTSLPIAEALLIVVADAIAQESGITQRTLSLNSIGTTESSNRFVRDTGTFLRKHLESIMPNLRPRAATDPLGTLVQLIERSHPAVARAPQSVEYLIEEERRRFWEVIEYLETAELPYEIKPHLLGSREFWSHTLFQISALDSETGSEIPLAFGGRYDPLAQRLAGRSVPSAVVTISCEIRGKTRPQERRASKPSLYFAHLGTEARRRTLRVLELLRKESIPVHQSLLCERMGEQMALAKKLSLPHMLIMGHKEAMEGTVLVRETATNSQEAVAIEDLVPYLRRHRIAVA